MPVVCSHDFKKHHRPGYLECSNCGQVRKGTLTAKRNPIGKAIADALKKRR